MIGQRDLVLQDYFDMLRRRVWWIVVPAILGPTLAIVVCKMIPARYTSETLVLVEQQKVPDEYVRPVITDDLNARLASMQEQILSRTRLEPIVERFGMYSEEPIPMEVKVEKVRKAVGVSPIRSAIAGRAGITGFYISFTANKPQLAQQICTEITSMFLSENLKAREQRAQGTTHFIQAQLDAAKRGLDEQDRKLAEFQRKFMGRLPGQEQTNFSMLTTLNTQMTSLTQSMAQDQQQKAYLESILAQQVAEWREAKSGASPQVVDNQLQQLQAQLVALQAKYTPDHPDVRKLQRDIERLKSRETDKEPVKELDSGSRPEPASIQQLRAQLRSIEHAITSKRQDIDATTQKIRSYEAKIEVSPAVQEEYKKLTRDYQTALQFYNELLTKKNQSEMATDLERKQQGEQFMMMDPPNLPETPAFPKRRLFLMLGFAGGMFIGLATATAVEFRDSTLRNERDITQILELPMLGMIPQIAFDAPNSVFRSLSWKRAAEATGVKKG